MILKRDERRRMLAETRYTSVGIGTGLGGYSPSNTRLYSVWTSGS